MLVPYQSQETLEWNITCFHMYYLGHAAETRRPRNAVALRQMQISYSFIVDDPWQLEVPRVL